MEFCVIRNFQHRIDLILGYQNDRDILRDHEIKIFLDFGGGFGLGTFFSYVRNQTTNEFGSLTARKGDTDSLLYKAV